LFGLVIAKMGSGAESEKPAGGEVEPLLASAGDRALPWWYGASRPKPLVFPLEIYCKHRAWYELHDVQAVEEWLFNRRKPELLTIFDPDMGNWSYECWLSGATRIVRIDKRVVGWRFDVVCTSPYMLGDWVEKAHDCSKGQAVRVECFNNSNIKDYIYPDLRIEMASGAASIRIDSGREPSRPFIMTGFAPGETIIVKGSLWHVASASGASLASKCNLNFPRLADGSNTFSVAGKCRLVIRHRPCRTGSGY
jgi:hypothetical protein